MKLLSILNFILTVAANEITSSRSKRAVRFRNSPSFRASVAIDRFDGIYCSGALIRPDVVITNARCTDQKLSTYSVYFNTVIDQVDKSNKNIRYGVKKIFHHYDYLAVDSTAAINNLGLFKLDRVVTGVKPITLITNESILDVENGFLAGWANPASRNSLADSELIDATFTIRDSNECKSVYIKSIRSVWKQLSSAKYSALTRYDTNQLLCATIRQSNGVIYHDDGEPFFIKYQGEYQLAGIVSFLAEGDKQPNAPPESYFMITKVSAFISFINKKIKEL